MKKAFLSIAAATLIILTGCSNAAAPIQAEDHLPPLVAEPAPEPTGPLEREAVSLSASNDQFVNNVIVEDDTEVKAEPELQEPPAAPQPQEYAKSAGVNLDSTAVDCRDNPITAGAHCTCLGRDIESRLNRYAKDETILDVWVWAESRADGNFWDNYPAQYNKTISPDDINLFIGRIIR